MSGDEWETPFDEVWGDLPRLLRRWRTSSLGVSSFLLVLRPFFFCIHSVVANSPVCSLVQLRDGQNSRASTGNVLRRLLSTQKQLTTSTIWLILVP